MRVVFAGTPEAALPSLDAIADSAHELVGVVTRPDAPAGRGRTLAASPVASGPRSSGSRSSSPTTRATPTSRTRLRGLAPDCCPVVAYGALLPRSALDIPVHGWVNLHFSVLPAWRGAAPVQHAIWAGEEVTGATTFRIVPALDAGPVYGVMTETIRPRRHRRRRCSAGSPRVGPGCWSPPSTASPRARWRRATSRPRASRSPPRSPSRTPRSSGRRPAAAVDRRVRACTPGPGAWSTYDGERIKLGPVTLDADHEPLPPGRLAVSKNAVHVGTGHRAGAARRGKAFGKRQMPAADWARGVRIAPDARLG